MGVLAGIFYLLGFVTAALVGFNGVWLGLFVSALILVVGYVFARLPQLYAMGFRALGGLVYVYILNLILAAIVAGIGAGVAAIVA